MRNLRSYAVEFYFFVIIYITYTVYISFLTYTTVFFNCLNLPWFYPLIVIMITYISFDLLSNMIIKPRSLLGKFFLVVFFSKIVALLALVISIIIMSAFMSEELKAAFMVFVSDNVDYAMHMAPRPVMNVADPTGVFNRPYNINSTLSSQPAATNLSNGLVLVKGELSAKLFPGNSGIWYASFLQQHIPLIDASIDPNRFFDPADNSVNYWALLNNRNIQTALRNIV